MILADATTLVYSALAASPEAGHGESLHRDA